MSGRVIRGLPVLLCLLAPPLALAEEWSVQVGPDARWFDWREYRQGSQLLRESGPVGGLALQVEVRSGAGFARLDALAGGGLAHYDGHLQSGANYQSDAWETLSDVHLRAGWRDAGNELSAGLLGRGWHRYIEGSATVSSAEELYLWRIATLGAAHDLARLPGWRVAVDVGMPVDSYQKVYSGYYDDFELEPGKGVYWRLALSHRLAADRRFTLEPWYQEQHLGDSAAVRLTQGGVDQGVRAYQPASTRRELGLTLRFRLGATREEAASTP